MIIVVEINIEKIIEIDDAFFNRTGLDRVGVVGPD